jgi:VanZ family protein
MVLRAVVWEREISLKLILFSVVLCLGYAVSDELHQLFVPERAFQLQDLLVDGGGILVGILLQYVRRR